MSMIAQQTSNKTIPLKLKTAAGGGFKLDFEEDVLRGIAGCVKLPS
jgi:hypothetical protein